MLPKLFALLCCTGDCMPGRLGDGWKRGTGFGLEKKPGDPKLGKGESQFAKPAPLDRSGVCRQLTSA